MTTASTSKIRFSCDCGRKYVCRPRDAGRTAQCHDCGRDLIVPLVDSDVACEAEDSARSLQSSSLGTPTTRLDASQEKEAERVFSTQLEKVREDGFVTEEESLALVGLRESLGLSPLRWVRDSKTSRCPMCASSLTAEATICPSCGYQPETDTSASDHPDVVDLDAAWLKIKTDFPSQVRPWCCTWGLVSLAIVMIVSVYQTTLDGPQFLGFFTIFVWSAVISVFAMRFLARDYLGRYVLAAILTIELIAIVRLGYGVSHGMSRFGILFEMMFGSPIVLALSASATDGGSSGFSSGSCSSGSSCGGGGCGGGGCGGCGG
jgi:hypothetical protein